MVRHITGAAAALLVLAAGAAPAAAQQAPSQREALAAASGWSAWLGCWRPTGEEAPSAALVCIVPGEAASSIRMISLDDGAVVAESAVHADGRPRPVEEGGCTGTETATWSQDGRRVFTRTELTCNGVRRVSTGVIAMVAENEWIDAQAVTVADQHAARAVRYRALRPEYVPVAAAQYSAEQDLALETARLNAARPLDVEAVVEASALVAEPALEALLAARQHGFGLNARTLVELEQRGVAPSVIDMMVALSYPRNFAVQEQPRARQADEPQWPVAQRGMANRCQDLWYQSMRRMECEQYYGYSPFGYRSRYGYSPFGYDPYGWQYGRTPIVVIVRPEEGETRGGEVVPGRGYTRGTATPTGREARPRDPQPAPASSRTPNSGSGESSAGSSGSSGSSTGRQAVPRPGGNDNNDQGN
jgi:hypothetical protein